MATKLKLKENGAATVPYSDTERTAFAALPRGKAATTSEVLVKIYGDEVPYHGRNILNSTIRSLARKIEINREPFAIERSPRRGPHPMTIRVAARD